jgi:hypothetical protein
MNRVLPYQKYNPALTLKENASIIGCSVSALKKHLRNKGIDTQFDSVYSRWKTINDYHNAHPTHSLKRKSEVLGYSINTIRKYEALSEDSLLVSFRNTKKVSQFDIRNNNVIKSVSSSQAEILSGIMKLHNDGNPFDADLTASLLKFYKQIPAPKNLYDKYPQMPQIRELTEADSLPAESFSSVVFDLPFIIAAGSKSLIKERFTQFDSVEELYQANDEMLSRSYRLLKKGGLLVVKTMDVCSGGKQYWVSDYILRQSQELGFELLDKFILLADNRPFSRTKKQHYARKYHSFFFVLRKQ